MPSEAMWIRRLEVTHCAGIAAAGIDFEPGLNVLHGPNELGKSSLVAAIRAALLLQSSATAAEPLADWNSIEPPAATLVLEQEPGRIWKVRKEFGRRGHAYLDFSRDGRQFQAEHRGREVEGSLQAILRWGIEAPGGRGGRRGMPSSLITTALLGEQSDVVAILDQSLAGDPNATGRERLTEALQALAEDPRFKQVVTAVQARVDEAFTATGRKRTGRGSPWADLKERRENAAVREREIRQQVDESHGAKERVAQLNEQLLDARAEQERLAEALGLRRQREAAEEAKSAAQATFEHARRVVKQLADNEKAVEEATATAKQLIAARAGLDKTKNELAPQAEAARERVRELESGAEEQQRRLREQEAENRRLAIQGRLKEHDDRVAEAEALAAVATAVAAGAQAIDAIEAKLTEHVELVERARDANDEDTADIQELELKRDVVRCIAASADLEAATRDRDAARSLVDEAAERERNALALREHAAELNAPDEGEIERLREAETEWQVARAKLSVGLVAELTLTGAGNAVAQVDGEPQTLTFDAGKAAIEAERELTLTIPEVASIRVRGGGSSLQSEAEAAEHRWQEASSAIFSRTGCDSLAALVELKDRAAATLAQAHDLTSEAQTARLRAEGLDRLEQRVATAHAAAQRQRDAVEVCLDGEETIEEFAEGIEADDEHASWDDDAWNTAIAERTEALRKRERLCDQLDNEIKTDERENTRLRQELSDNEARLREGGVRAGDWQATLDGAAAERDRLNRELTAVETELEAIRTEATTEVDAAREAHEELEQRLTSATQALQENTDALAAAHTHLARLQGETGPLRANAEGEDLDGAKAALEAATQALAQLPAIEDATDVTEAETQAERAGQLVTELELELRKAEGALEQMGGQVLDEKREQVEETVKALDSRERELELDYEAWRLLGDTLAEANQASAAHLGNALVEPVSRRMGALTRGRYGDIAIGPQLNATGIALAGGDRPFNSLSIGTQEQIALLLRLAIAEALGTFVILDDQLTQSDTTRMNAMRGVLTEAAQHVQILIFTCHPTDYPLDAANVVDLTQHVTRSDRAPESPSTPPASNTRAGLEAPEEPPHRTNRRRRRNPPDTNEAVDTATALKNSMESR